MKVSSSACGIAPAAPASTLTTVKTIKKPNKDTLMKKLTALMTVALIAIASLALTSCEDDNERPYYFDLNEALNGYFDRYGDFGTDQRTTADWFDYYYPYAND